MSVCAKVLQTETCPGETAVVARQTENWIMLNIHPEFAMSGIEQEGLSKWKLRCLQEEKNQNAEERN